MQYYIFRHDWDLDSSQHQELQRVELLESDR